jgi:hypothetical protein
MIGTAELPTRDFSRGVIGMVQETHSAVESLTWSVVGVSDATGKPSELETTADVRLL